jgi:hypothetical protein
LHVKKSPLTARQQYIVELVKTISTLPPDPPTSTPDVQVIKKRLRRKDHRQAIINDLIDFRYKYWLQHFKRCSWGPEALLPQKTLEFLATNAHIRTPEHLKLFLSDWAFVDVIGSLALKQVADADQRWYDKQGVQNPLTKVLETPEEKQARYNTNRREKRRKVKSTITDPSPQSISSIESTFVFQFYEGSDGTFTEDPTQSCELLGYEPPPPLAPAAPAIALTWCPQSPVATGCSLPKKPRKSRQKTALSLRATSSSSSVAKPLTRSGAASAVASTSRAGTQTAVPSMQFTFEAILSPSADLSMSPLKLAP